MKSDVATNDSLLRLIVKRMQHERPAAGHPLSMLSKRECEVFFHMVAGRTMREAAAAMCLRLKTIEKHRSRVLKKIEARNAVEAVHFAVCHGLLAVVRDQLPSSDFIAEPDTLVPPSDQPPSTGITVPVT